MKEAEWKQRRMKKFRFIEKKSKLLSGIVYPPVDACFTMRLFKKKLCVLLPWLRWFHLFPDTIIYISLSHIVLCVVFVQSLWSCAFITDIYADWMGSALKAPLRVESWTNGGGGVMPSRCDTAFFVENVCKISLDGRSYFTSHHDHSKWAIAYNSSSPWICIADINRMVIRMAFLVGIIGLEGSVTLSGCSCKGFFFIKLCFPVKALGCIADLCYTPASIDNFRFPLKAMFRWRQKKIRKNVIWEAKQWNFGNKINNSTVNHTYHIIIFILQAYL